VERIRQFIHEVHRRSVWQVLGIFLAVGWVVLQVVEVLTETAGLPDWTPTMALVLLLLGLPVCVATAFVQEGMPGGDRGAGARPFPDERPGQAAARATAGSASAEAEAPANLAAGTGSLDRPSSRPRRTKRLLTWRNAVLGGIGAFTLLGFSLVAYFVMWTAGIGPVGNLVAQGVLETRDPVILAEFDNRTSDESLGAVVTDALRVDLLESQVVTVVDDGLVTDALGRMGRSTTDRLTGDIAREIAIREGIKAVIEGDVSRVGTGYLLSVEIVAAQDGASLAAFRETAEDDSELLPAIDRLSQKLREKAGESLRDIRAGEPLEAVTTSSLEALRLFAQASEALERGDRVRGVDLLEEAVAIDSTFAMAWRRLAAVYSNIGGDQEAVLAAASAAYRHRDRLTERERYLAEAYYHDQVTLDENAEADAYRRVLEIQPDDRAALNNLALQYFADNDLERARDLLVRAIEGPGRSRNAYNNLVLVLYGLRQHDAALGTLDEAVQLYPEDADLRALRPRTLWGMGRITEALEDAQAVLDDFPSGELTKLRVLFDMAGIEASRGRVEAARGLSRERRALAASLGRPGAVFGAELTLANLDFLVGGDSLAVARRVERRFDEIFAGVPEANRPYGDMAGMWAGVGDTDRARVWSDRALAAFPEEARSSAFYQELLLIIEGYLGLAEGDFELTLERMEEVRRRQRCDDCFLEVLADAWEGLGQPDSAIVHLERFLDLSSFDGIPGIEQQMARRLSQLARLYEDVGRPGDAADAWTRFADRWTDADPVLQPRVRAARAEAERLAREAS
jgi:tetratricopeptide (TPR) repeat protein